MILLKSTTAAAATLAALLASTSAFGQDATTPPPVTEPTVEMQAVLDKLAELGAKPFHELSVPEARSQATPADAARAVQWEERVSSGPEGQMMTRDIAIPTENGNLPARVYMPEGEGPFPVIVYYHGGGWVVADINVYDATPRGLVVGTNAIVVSVDYRHAPENKFPAQHEDAWAAYAWVVENIHTMNGDAGRIAVAGESAGGNLAANVAIMARDMEATVPLHQLLVYPIAGDDMDTPSYQEHADAKPLGKADMEWFVSHVFASMDEAADPRVDLYARDDLEDLPPTTIINAEIDLLRSDGEMLAEALEADGVEVTQQTFAGVTHEFFGMAKVVPEAKQAMDLAISDLNDAFAAAGEEN
jgi:acetyl esterase/lipase